MNKEPHVHAVEIHRTYRNINAGDLEITYGDTTVTVLYDAPHFGRHERRRKLTLLDTNPAKAERLIKEAAAHAITKHDEGSQHALDLNGLAKELTPKEASWR